jgi:L-2-hydroxyglutarate oxidase LhgO
VTTRADVVVIGAGVVGLACARALARAGRDVVVVERHGRAGAETSSRNSEVIHAGIYYPTGSAKARWCVAGRDSLYRYCDDHGVAYRRCGKIIVACNDSEIAQLRAYQEQAERNGAGRLRWLTAKEVAALEPAVRAVAGVLSEHTGIIDSHAYLLALQGDLEAAGAMIAFATEVTGIDRAAALRLQTSAGVLDASWVINAAGLWAPALIRHLCPSAPRAYFARGRYYGYEGPAPFSRLVYPVAGGGGLGVHVTVDLAGQVRFGPDVEWIDGVDYRFDDSRRGAFAEAIRRYYPEVDAERLRPGYTGVRPKISGPGEGAADFRLDGPRQHGVPGLVNLLGIESPGLTASLAIAESVTAVVQGGK